jgi:hypothetical protein
VVNGVWLSGGGVRASEQAAPHVESLYADSPLPRDLARACGVEVASAAHSLEAWIGAGPKSPSLVWLPAIGASGPKSALTDLGRDWAEPLSEALAARTALEVRVAISGRGCALSFTPSRPSLAARWRARLAPPVLSTQLAAARR